MIIMNTRKPNILIIDDDKDVLAFLKEEIEEHLSHNCNIDLSPDGQHALDLMKAKQNIDVIVLDMVMPVVDGMGFLKEITKENFSIAPIIVVSGHLNDDYIHNFKEMKVHSIYEKPLDIQVFLNSLDSAIAVALSEDNIKNNLPD